jgi:long-chain fatty acid transport protein
MKFILSGLAVLALSTAAHAGGIDRSGQSITPLFEAGNYAELSFGSVNPTVKGVFTHPLAGALPSGDVAPSYTLLGLALKLDLNDRLSLGLIIDAPFGADVNYATAGYPLVTTNATVDTTALSFIGRYKLNDAFSVHAGVRSITASGVFDPAGPYASTYSAGTDTGYLVGVAYEKPEIALRVALTYASATDFALDGTVGDLTATMPQSVNLDVQSGIAANTLLFGSVRWADWSSATIDDTLAGNLVDYTNDTVTYSLGVGRKFSDSFSGAVTLGYEAGDGLPASNLSPTDGFFSIGLGGTYTKGNMKISGGVRYVQIGDTVTEASGAFPGGSVFKDNTAVGLGLKVAFTF